MDPCAFSDRGQCKGHVKPTWTIEGHSAPLCARHAGPSVTDAFFASVDSKTLYDIRAIAAQQSR